jgi:hypothetical protein
MVGGGHAARADTSSVCAAAQQWLTSPTRGFISYSLPADQNCFRMNVSVTVPCLTYSGKVLAMATGRTLLRTINALTLATRDMPKSCAFYAKLGLIRTPLSHIASYSTVMVYHSTGRITHAIPLSYVWRP